MVSQQFNEKADAVKDLPKRPNDDELLKLYALFKQATVGDNETSRPGFLDLKGKYKWDAWTELKGTSQEDAEQQYIAFADELITKYT